MYYRKVSGLVAFIVGATMLVVGLYAKNRVSGAKNTMDKITGEFTDKPAGKMFGGMMDAKAQEYDTLINWVMGVGIAFSVVGGVVLIIYRKHKWSK